MMKQKHISRLIGIHQSDVSRLLSGKKKVSWPLAERLTDIFPSKDVRGWKYATPEDLKRAFEQLNIKEVA